LGNESSKAIPYSLFFVVDLVAIDCVMTDLIHEEGRFSDHRGYDFLFFVQEADLGLCEGTCTNPRQRPYTVAIRGGYSILSYTRIDL
jgi:hypothetical protein